MQIESLRKWHTDTRHFEMRYLGLKPRQSSTPFIHPPDPMVMFHVRTKKPLDGYQVTGQPIKSRYAILVPLEMGYIRMLKSKDELVEKLEETMREAIKQLVYEGDIADNQS